MADEPSSTIDTLVTSLRDRLVSYRGEFRSLSDKYDLDYSWVSKFANGRVDNPTIRQLRTLENALDARDANDGE